MDEIEKAVKTLAQLAELEVYGYASEAEVEFINENNIGVPLAWMVEGGLALATEEGNSYILDSYRRLIGDSNE